MEASLALDGSLALAMYQNAATEHKPYNEIKWYYIGATSNNTSLASKEVRARTLMFAQIFYRCYGADLEPYDALQVAEYAEKHLAGVAHVNPSEIEAWFKDGKVGVELKLEQHPLYISPEPHALGVTLLVWKCNYVFRGRFSWAPGRTDAFVNWLGTNAAHQPVGMTDLLPGAAISCWEAVFYAMIKTGTMAIAPVHQAYMKSGLGTTASACLQMLKDMLTYLHRDLQRIDMKAADYKHQTFNVGDIILIPGDKSDEDPNSVLHHVVLVIANTGPGGPDSTEIFHLWGSGASNFCDIAQLGDFNGRLERYGYPARYFRCRLL